MKLKYVRYEQLYPVALWNFFIGLLTVPVNLLVAAQLAASVAAVANADWQSCLFHACLFALFTVFRLLLLTVSKTKIERLRVAAEQSYRQFLYQRFMGGISPLHQTKPTTFTTLFRRDAQQITAYYAEILPAILISAIGLLAYASYISLALNGIAFMACMLAFGMLSLLQPIILEKFLVKNFIEADRVEAILSQHITSGFEGYATLKLLNLHNWYMAKFRPLQRAYWRVGMRASAAGTLNVTMEDINRFLQTLGLVIVLGWAMLNGWTTFAAAMQIYLLSSGVYVYISKLFQIKSDTATCRAALSQIDAYLPAEDGGEEDAAVPRTNTAAEVCVSGLSYEFGEKPLFDQIGFTLSPGDRCLVRGENGAGKSTLFALLMGQIQPLFGQIMIDGERVTPNAKCLQERIAYCPQAIPSLHCTARALFTGVLTAQPNVSEELLTQYCCELGLQESDLSKPISDLSGGTQKKILLCLALAKQAPLLLLDEPEAMLDQETAKKLTEILRGQTRTIMVISHSTIFDEITDCLLIVEKGCVCKSSHGRGVT